MFVLCIDRNGYPNESVVSFDSVSLIPASAHGTWVLPSASMKQTAYVAAVLIEVVSMVIVLSDDPARLAPVCVESAPAAAWAPDAHGKLLFRV